MFFVVFFVFYVYFFFHILFLFSFFFFFFFNDTATTEIYTLFPTRRSSDLDRARPVCRSIVHHDQITACWKQADRKSTRLNSSHANISYAVFCLKKKKKK